MITKNHHGMPNMAMPYGAIIGGAVLLGKFEGSLRDPPPADPSVEQNSFHFCS